MPGTRKKVQSSEAAATPPKTGRRKKETEADPGKTTPASSASDGNVSEKPPVKQAKAKATATPGRSGRPQKDNKADGSSLEGSLSPKKDVDKPPPAPTATGPRDVEVFSPRRSGRSVVPNRRFQDMEIDLAAMGRKRPKDPSSADTPAPKRSKTAVTKKSSEKIKDSPAKNVMTKTDAAEMVTTPSSKSATKTSNVKSKSKTGAAPSPNAVATSAGPSSVPSHKQKPQQVSVSVSSSAEKVSRTVSVSRSLPFTGVNTPPATKSSEASTSASKTATTAAAVSSHKSSVASTSKTAVAAATSSQKLSVASTSKTSVNSVSKSSVVPSATKTSSVTSPAKSSSSSAVVSLSSECADPVSVAPSVVESSPVVVASSFSSSSLPEKTTSVVASLSSSSSSLLSSSAPSSSQAVGETCESGVVVCVSSTSVRVDGESRCSEAVPSGSSSDSDRAAVSHPLTQQQTHAQHNTTSQAQEEMVEATETEAADSNIESGGGAAAPQAAMVDCDMIDLAEAAAHVETVASHQVVVEAKAGQADQVVEASQAQPVVETGQSDHVVVVESSPESTPLGRESRQVTESSSGPVGVLNSPRSLLSGSSSSSKSSGVTDTAPGRVVGNRPQIVPSSKSVFIVRQPLGQSHSHTEDQQQHSPQKSSLLSTVLNESSSSNRLTTVTREAGVGEVMSIVELSPNRKVPVVVAERKEHVVKMPTLVSAERRVRVLSSSQLPHTIQKMVLSSSSSSSSHQTSSLQLGQPSEESQSSPLPEQQQQTRMVTVRIGTPPPRNNTQQACSADGSKKTESCEQEPSDRATGQQSSSTADHSLPPEVQAPKAQQASAGTSTSEARTTASSKDGSTSCEDSGEGGAHEKYVTSGTQTPYTKKNLSKKVITVHVHPPSKDGEKNTEVVTVTRVEKGDNCSSSDMADVEERETIVKHEVVGAKGKYIIVDLPKGSTVKQRHADTLDSQDDSDSEEGREAGPEDGEGDKGGKNEKYIIVDLPEGTTVKQQYARRAERIDNDPDFYTMDEKGLFTCNVCQYQSYRRANFYKHKKKHLGLRPYQCDQCAYRAATTSNLKRHQEIHRDIRNHKCPVCGLYFRQKIHLERHIKYRHEEKKVKCPLCDYVCANENPDLKVHIKRRHMPSLGGQDAMSAFKCPQCGLLASSKRDLRQHLKFHSKGPELKLFCNMCSFVTDCESRLRRHQYIHTKEKPFQCGLCDYRGSQKEHVLRHMRTQHNIEIERKHRVKKPGDKSLEGEGSSGNGKVLEKADYTSDEKIFACNHCNMKFSKLINLYKHLHTQHRDIMPMEKDEFSCVVCDFRTTNKKNLLVHMRRHNVADQTPPSHVYSCVLCRYMNPKRRNLFQHMRKKHHIEIVMRDDGSSTCYVSSEQITGSSGVNSVVLGPGGHPLSDQQGASSSQHPETVVNILPITDLISTISHPSAAELQAAAAGSCGEGINTITINHTTHTTHTSAISMSPTSAPTTTTTTGILPTTIKMEDLAVVVSNPNGHTGPGMLREGVMEGGNVTFTLGAGGRFTQDDAAEAIQGLQALAERGVLDSNPGPSGTSTGANIVEEQVQVMGSDDQTTLVIEPNGLSLVEQLVAPKSEPLEVMEMDTSLLQHHTSPSSSILPLPDASSAQVAVGQGDGSGFQLSAEQLMNLSTGDLLEINGDMFRVEVTTEGSQGQQIISFEPATMSAMDEETTVLDAPVELSQEASAVILSSTEVGLESMPEIS